MSHRKMVASSTEITKIRHTKVEAEYRTNVKIPGILSLPFIHFLPLSVLFLDLDDHSLKGLF